MATTTPPANSLTIPSTNRAVLRILSDICFLLGFASIVLSISVWSTASTPDAAHAERFGIFIGLWAPTFFALSDRLSRYGKAMLAEGSKPPAPARPYREHWGA